MGDKSRDTLLEMSLQDYKFDLKSFVLQWLLKYTAYIIFILFKNILEHSLPEVKFFHLYIGKTSEFWKTAKHVFYQFGCTQGIQMVCYQNYNIKISTGKMDMKYHSKDQ